jgi:hypothetical protein
VHTPFAHVSPILQQPLPHAIWPDTHVVAAVHSAVTGVVRLTFVPSPSWRTSFFPQHWTVPSWSRAQACSPPAVISTTLVRLVGIPPGIDEGTTTATAEKLLKPDGSPFPNWPLLLIPQQRTSRFWSRAQV